jgi:hypothetical protein
MANDARVLFRRKLAKHALQHGDPQLFACRLQQCTDAEAKRFRVRRAASRRAASVPACCPQCWVPWVPSVTVRVRLVRKPTRARRRVISNEAVHTCLSCFFRLPLPVAVRGYVRLGEDRWLKRRHAAALAQPAKRAAAAVARGPAVPTPKQKIASAIAHAKVRPATVSNKKPASLLSQFLQKL